MISAAAIASPRLGIDLLDPHDPRAEEIWCTIERQRSPPYFQTWGWISTWLAHLPRDEAPLLAVAFAGDVPVAAFFLGRRTQVRHRVLLTRSLFLNTTGREQWDDLTVEHNGILCAPGAGLSLAALVESLPGGWDELSMPALSRIAFPGSALRERMAGHLVRIDRVAPSPYVDLARVRGAEGGYLGLLGSGTRAQIRRAERGFGEFRLEVASTLAHGLDIYGELVELHGKSWRARGLPGAFADPWFDDFHRDLIGSRFAHGEIQLLRLSSRGKTVGCLYNLVSAGRVLFYQGGLERFDDPHLKPGYVCHAAAVRHNASAGHATYDLLGGDCRYKRSLSTDSESLVWARIQRRSMRFGIEASLRRLKRALRPGR